MSACNCHQKSRRFGTDPLPLHHAIQPPAPSRSTVFSHKHHHNKAFLVSFYDISVSLLLAIWHPPPGEKFFRVGNFEWVPNRQQKGYMPAPTNLLDCLEEPTHSTASSHDLIGQTSDTSSRQVGRRFACEHITFSTTLARSFESNQ